MVAIYIDGTRSTVAKKTFHIRPRDLSISKWHAGFRSMSHINHTNIVSLLDFYLTDGLNVILMEYADSGSLYDYLHRRSSDKRVIDVAKLNWMIQCANVSFVGHLVGKSLISNYYYNFKGLAYLQEQNVFLTILNAEMMLLTDNFRTLKISIFAHLYDIIISNDTESENIMGTQVFTTYQTQLPNAFITNVYMNLNLPRYYDGEDLPTKFYVFMYGHVFWKLIYGELPIETFMTGKNDFNIIFVSTQNIHKIYFI